MATERSWPYDFETDGTTPQETTQSDGTKLWRMHAVSGAQDGVFDVGYFGPMSAALTVNNVARAGDTPDALQTTLNAADRTINVSNGMALVRGIAYELTGGDKTVTFGANSSGNPRYDRLVLKHEPAAWKTRLAVKVGTAGASPVVPTLTQIDGGVWEIPLRTVLVRNGVGAFAAGDMQNDDRWFLTYRPAHTLVVAAAAHASTADVFTNMPAAVVTEAGFYVPPTGQVLVTVGASNNLTVANDQALLGFEIRAGSATGTVLTAATLAQAARWRDAVAVAHSAGPFLVSGLPAGVHCTARLQQRTNGAGQWANPYLTVEPVL